ncbi:UDP-N-acetylglucosamine 2-epimerase (hydrolyzing) [Campylobacter sp. FMV-PI01]|uniref:UDP-N-acetylglucosamine 2-epimerase (Hydrolyzing) n=1 Tax=Campylobacter portucalensis TaxID=2608384 RepID=A0A6L5WF49_9BACT|nr:UDP-N-acetylglucosamine 2-epimerase [Campylobacter portucalensis]MSN95608.1 UDP-N-acetylglucosamine 2-epimerase (hydrolyzing) [Campylobacter portucalensis]
MKKLLFITGTRADFGKIKPLLNYVEKSSKFELYLIVTGMHMMEIYGGTFREILNHNYKNIYLASNQFKNEPMSSVTANTINLFSRFFDEINPDMIFIHGDRLEALSGAIAGAFSNTLVCHIEGGEISGTIDESIRHAVSKFSHLHLVANKEAKNRLIKMGEDKKTIFIIGSPDLDVMASDDLPNLSEALNHYEINFKDYALSLFHPVTTETKNLEIYTKNYFDALKKSDLNYIIIYPNNDSGSKFIIDEISNLKELSNFKIFPSIRFEYFLTLLKNAKFIIGNSSAGIREAPFYKVKTINVGTRQNGRIKDGVVLNVSYKSDEILKAIKSLDKFNPKFTNEFGSGNSVSEFDKFINNDEIWQTNIQKRFYE